MSKQILIAFELFDEQIDEIKQNASTYEVIDSVDQVRVEDLEIIVGWSDELTAIVQNEKSQVKWVQYPFAGVNTLPLELFAHKDIVLSNGSGIHAYSVSESTMGLILGMTRNIVVSVKNQLKNEWVNVDRLYELYGKTMLIAGAGKIGVHLGQIAKGFGMKTIGINRSGRPIENMDEQFTQKELYDVIHKADIVVNILPATKETAHLFDSKMFSAMKDEAIFVNVGRGETVDTQALIEALDNNKLMFTGLDVYEEEPLPANHPLWKHEKVVMTPHIAGRVESYPDHFYAILKTNLATYLAEGQIKENVVELESGY